MMKKSKKSGPDWSELHQELLEIIATKLSFLDIIRFKAVCTSWLAAAGRFSSGPLLILPLLQETHDSGEDQAMGKLGALCIKNLKIYDLNFSFERPEDYFTASESFRFVGSSHGWLVVTEEKYSEIYLLNLFSRTRVSLPGKGTIPIPEKYVLGQTTIQKAILTANPSLDKNYKVIITYGSLITCMNLAFCGLGDQEWHELINSEEGYEDLVYCNLILYVLRKGKIDGWDFSNSSSTPTKKFSLSLDCCCNYEPEGENRSTQWYLVPSSTEILIIKRYIGEFVDGEGRLHCEADTLTDEDSHPLVFPYRTVSFKVYKLNMMIDQEKIIMESVKTLKDDQLIFLGGNHGISISTKDFPELVANTIYFTDDYWDRMYEDYLYGGHDIGSFSLEDESVTRLDFDGGDRIDPTPIWVFPS